MITDTRRPRTRPRIPTDFVAISGAAIVGAALLRNTDTADFERFIGNVPPIVAVAVASAAGAAALVLLDSAGWVGSDPSRRGLARSTVIALGLGAAIIVADSALGFGEEINVPWPASVLFYPVIALIAEVAFHLVPLALVVMASRRWHRLRKGAGAVTVPIIAVALFEAVYQIVGTASGDISPWLLAYLGLHLIVFASAGLTSLRQYGFGSMIWLRLVYYAIWHVAWGVLRLDLLF